MLIPKADRKKIHEVSFIQVPSTVPFKSRCDTFVNTYSDEHQLTLRSTSFGRAYSWPRRTSTSQSMATLTPRTSLYVSMFPDRKRLTLTTTGRQSLPIPHLPRLPQDPVQLAILLLHPDPRRSRLPTRMASPSCRDRPSYAHQAAGCPCSSSWHDGW